ncbi:Uncharacterised protein [Mycobacteroides abscessus]|nr:Uncharacterised protein [Mycobacteroides abscessus]
MAKAVASEEGDAVALAVGQQAVRYVPGGSVEPENTTGVRERLASGRLRHVVKFVTLRPVRHECHQLCGHTFEHFELCGVVAVVEVQDALVLIGQQENLSVVSEEPARRLSTAVVPRVPRAARDLDRFDVIPLVDDRRPATHLVDRCLLKSLPRTHAPNPVTGRHRDRLRVGSQHGRPFPAPGLTGPRSTRRIVRRVPLPPTAPPATPLDPPPAAVRSSPADPVGFLHTYSPGSLPSGTC